MIGSAVTRSTASAFERVRGSRGRSEQTLSMAALSSIARTITYLTRLNAWQQPRLLSALLHPALQLTVLRKSRGLDDRCPQVRTVFFDIVGPGPLFLTYYSSWPTITPIPSGYSSNLHSTRKAKIYLASMLMSSLWLNKDILLSEINWRSTDGRSQTRNTVASAIDRCTIG